MHAEFKSNTFYRFRQSKRQGEASRDDGISDAGDIEDHGLDAGTAIAEIEKLPALPVEEGDSGSEGSDYSGSGSGSSTDSDSDSDSDTNSNLDSGQSA